MRSTKRQPDDDDNYFFHMTSNMLAIMLMRFRFIAPKIFNYLAFQFLDFERTR